MSEQASFKATTPDGLTVRPSSESRSWKRCALHAIHSLPDLLEPPRHSYFADSVINISQDLGVSVPRQISP